MFVAPHTVAYSNWAILSLRLSLFVHLISVRKRPTLLRYYLISMLNEILSVGGVHIGTFKIPQTARHSTAQQYGLMLHFIWIALWHALVHVDWLLHLQWVSLVFQWRIWFIIDLVQIEIQYSTRKEKTRMFHSINACKKQTSFIFIAFE